jgi:hypothetical protein
VTQRSKHIGKTNKELHTGVQPPLQHHELQVSQFASSV